MTDQPAYTKTVRDFTDRANDKHFVDPAEAVAYANDLLRQGHKAKIYDYKPPRSYIDHVIENEGDYR